MTISNQTLLCSGKQKAARDEAHTEKSQNDYAMSSLCSLLKLLQATIFGAGASGCRGLEFKDRLAYTDPTKLLVLRSLLSS